MTKPPVFIITPKPLATPGGFQTYVKTLQITLRYLGYPTRVFSLPPLPRPLAFLPVLSLFLSLKLMPHLKSHPIIIGIGPWSLAGAFLKLFYPHLKLIAFAPTTIKHEFAAEAANLRSPEYPLWPKLAAALAHISLIPLYSLLERWSLRQADATLVHYQSAKKLLTREYRLPAAKILLFPDTLPPLPRSKAETLSLSKGPPLILCVTRHDARKGINYLLRALSLLQNRHQPFTAIIAGTGTHLAAHRQLARSLQLTHVSLPGYVKNPSSLYTKASLFVLPSLEEGSSSLSLLEAMRAGLPIVTTRIDGILEDITHLHSGLLVPPANAKALAQAMYHLLTHPKLATHLGAQTQKAFLKRHSPYRFRIGITKLVSQFSGINSPRSANHASAIPF
ncbi:MAG: glycosyltransferase family 4 protein [Candidatus Chisholmbacteria bacterium]|nr:glycosyltransferase family 4 protein [Candidatus Chisholmbacteria bacterium]